LLYHQDHLQLIKFLLNLQKLLNQYWSNIIGYGALLSHKADLGVNDSLQKKVYLQLQLVKLKPNQSRSEEHTSELQSRFDLVCRLLIEKKNNTKFFFDIYPYVTIFYASTHICSLTSSLYDLFSHYYDIIYVILGMAKKSKRSLTLITQI